MSDGTIKLAQGNREAEIATLIPTDARPQKWLVVLKRRGDVLSTRSLHFLEDAMRIATDWTQLGRR